MTMEDVRYIKLSSGEDIVVTVIGENRDMMTIIKALTVKQSFDPETRTLYSGFYIWIPFKEYLQQESRLPLINVLVSTPVVGSMLKAYKNYIEYVIHKMPDQETDVHEESLAEEEIPPKRRLH